ncbi:branched-chain amino acid transport system permease protein [Thermocatellispora tengchongensis]|uniref:Branched-chain amino acid transport system permease protein n=1 Tax=Thermocatellispora tengchongensis TaxID=1073253 RepID=A0A840P8Q3_9ACTN|nr:branched-chain amino acid ABC transporter permease [Thermocatellispora tengchongensis]MBB5136048.1 branched-chain amino acid transport system permease protein [Thermocatellispora tengchongensis]
MTVLLQQILDGLTAGVLYAAIALSLVLVYRTSKLVNFAQGELATFGAFLTWQFHDWGLPLSVALPASVAVSFVAGALMERTLIRPLLESSNHLGLFIVCLGVLVTLLQVEAWIWGYQVKEMPNVAEGPPIALGPTMISRQNVVIIAACVLIAVALWFLFQRTRFGLAMRAASDNTPSANLLGLPVTATLTFSWGIAAVIGTLMASLVAPNQFLQPGMLLPVLLYSVAAATLGGLDSPVGAIVGGLVVGVVENLAGTYVPGIGQDFKQAVAFAIIMIVLLARPQGLFGSRTVVRV